MRVYGPEDPTAPNPSTPSATQSVASSRLVSPRTQCTFEDTAGPISSLAFSADSKLLASGSLDVAICDSSTRAGECSFSFAIDDRISAM